MCLSCGCGKPNDNHGDARNITLQDIDAAAQAISTTRAKVLENMLDSTQQLLQGSQETAAQAGSSTQTSPSSQSLNSTPSREGYDPAHSGVQPAHKQTGKRVEEQENDTGSAWGEDLQMGQTGTPDRPDLEY